MTERTGAFVSFTDDEREQCIDLCKQLAIGTSGGVQRWFYMAMVSLQKGRSREQVERLEREKGLRA